MSIITTIICRPSIILHTLEIAAAVAMAVAAIVTICQERKSA